MLNMEKGLKVVDPIGNNPTGSPLNRLPGRLYRAALSRLTKGHDHLLARFNYPRLESQLLRIQLLRKKYARGSANPLKEEQILGELEALVKRYPAHPIPYLRLAEFESWLGNSCQFDTINRYGEIRRQWLEDSGLAMLELAFVPPSSVIGALGNHGSLDNMLKAHQLGWLREKRYLISLPKRTPVRNPSLWSYFRPHLTVIEDPDVCQSLKGIEQVLTYPLGFCLPLLDTTPHTFIANGLAEAEWLKADRRPLFELREEHREKGRKVLETMGVPADAWYVTFHAREPGYRDGKNISEDFRNVNPESYTEAIKEITSAGGWVFRMGHENTTPMQPMPNVIDYAHGRHRSDWMDVFLFATSRFTIGTSSGPYIVSRLFGVPVLLTNLLPTFALYMLCGYDIYLPRLCRRLDNGEILGFRELFTPPVSTYFRSKAYEANGIEWIENTPEELAMATKEMLARFTRSEVEGMDELHSRCQKLCAEAALTHGGVPTPINPRMASDFLRRHASLLDN
jgi:putative glycosyltransferase (TIGR04372 family)